MLGSESKIDFGGLAHIDAATLGFDPIGMVRGCLSFQIM